jgi:ribonuclease I
VKITKRSRKKIDWKKHGGCKFNEKNKKYFGIK